MSVAKTQNFVVSFLNKSCVEKMHTLLPDFVMFTDCRQLTDTSFFENWDHIRVRHVIKETSKKVMSVSFIQRNILSSHLPTKVVFLSIRLCLKNAWRLPTFVILTRGRSEGRTRQEGEGVFILWHSIPSVWGKSPGTRREKCDRGKRRGKKKPESSLRHLLTALYGALSAIFCNCLVSRSRTEV